MTIRQRRKDRGWTQSQLAEAAGLSLRTIQRIERGQPPTDETLKALAAVFEVDLAELRGDLPIDQQVLNAEEEAALKYVRGKKLLFIEAMGFLTTMPILLFADFAGDSQFSWSLLLGIIWLWWLAGRAAQVFDVKTMFGAGWERREMKKFLGRDGGDKEGSDETRT